MSQSMLYHRTLERLLEADLDPRVQNLIDAAFESSDAIELALPTTASAVSQKRMSVTRPTIPRVFLKQVQVEGFRGIGPKLTFSVPAGPGLTLIVGRNGSGKSSLAEALEVALTGTSERWSVRKARKDWEAGWKNLHWQGAPWISADFHLDGDTAPVTVRRTWRDASADATELKVTRQGHEIDFDAVGWADAVALLPPFLSYNTLGRQLDEGPSKLYDNLDKVLGLEELAVVTGRLKDAQKAREAHKKIYKTARDEASAKASASNDERAQAASKHIKARSIDADALERLVEGELAGESGLAAVKRLAQWPVLDVERAMVLCADLEAATQHKASLEAELGEQMQDLSLLREAVRQHKRAHPSQCPVCDSPLSSDWLAKAEARIETLDRQTASLSTAKSAFDAAWRAVKTLTQATAVPTDADGAALLNLDALAAPIVDVAVAQVKVWRAAPEDAAALLAHVVTHADATRAAVIALRETAQKALGQLETEWRPVRESIRALLAAHQKAKDVEDEIKDLQAATEWVRAFEDELRAERFEPIAAKAQEIWSELRNQSNVALEGVRLTGTGNRRRVDLDVKVDESDASALGVMSQGELNALMLSLFLPRLMLDESPFRFVVIDDPVQAMDPAKVDGLARVLAGIAQTHQVIVLTHDTRLAESMRRLRIRAKVFNVARHKKSRVELGLERSPSKQLIDDALGLAKRGGGFPDEVLRRVIPGLCRGAFEAAFKEMAWSALLAQGLSHAEIEAKIENVGKTRDLARLALFGDAQGDVDAAIENRWGRDAKRAFGQCVGGAHGAFHGDYDSLIKDTRAALTYMDTV